MELAESRLRVEHDDETLWLIRITPQVLQPNGDTGADDIEHDPGVALVGARYHPNGLASFQRAGLVT